MELIKLKKQLEKAQKECDKYREKCADIYGNGTMRKARNQINWDYWAKEVFRLKGLIEEIEQI